MTFQSAPLSLLQVMTEFAYSLHIGGGAIGLASGTVAAFARKGGHLHRQAGKSAPPYYLRNLPYASLSVTLLPLRIWFFIWPWV